MTEKHPTFTRELLAAAAATAGLTLTNAELALMLEGVQQQLERYEQLRAVTIDNSVPPALRFDPGPPDTVQDDQRPLRHSSGQTTTNDQRTIHHSASVLHSKPAPELRVEEDLAFAPVASLAQLIQSHQISSVELTELYLRRLDRYDPALRCVVTMTGDLALEQARQADAEIAAGRYRGPLHGIPWGAKDLLATRGICTTWGAAPFADQVPEYDATVVERLRDAGAVLLAKLTLGELAWGDVWFGGQTKNPWNTEEGSSGSSAGSAAATAAGLVGFAIGSETWGSIVSPSTRCRVTGLRPTFGRISRHGAMALSWSMDKLGPICRSAEDCALVFGAIYGPDGNDNTVVDAPFDWQPDIRLAGMRIGYLKAATDEEPGQLANDQHVLGTLRQLGAELVPIELPSYPIEAMSLILSAEAAAAFDELTRSNRDDMLARQEQQAWPNALRQARLIPAVEYIQANRLRTLAMRAMDTVVREVDLYVSLGAADLLLTNLTGHPAVVVPTGVTEAGAPTSITFSGRLYDEATILAVAKAYQEATDFHLRRPPLDAPDLRRS